MRTKYYVNPRGALAAMSAVLMAAALAALLICSWAGLWPGWADFSAEKRLWWYTLLPAASEALFMLLLLLLGKRAVWATIPPVVGAAAFLCLLSGAAGAFWQGAVWCTLWVAAALAWFATVLGALDTPIPAVSLFLLGPVFRIFVELRGENIEWLPETAIFGLMLSLLCAAMALRRRPVNGAPPMPRRSYIDGQ